MNTNSGIATAYTIKLLFSRYCERLSGIKLYIFSYIPPSCCINTFFPKYVPIIKDIINETLLLTSLISNFNALEENLNKNPFTRGYKNINPIINVIGFTFIIIITSKRQKVSNPNNKF